MPLVSAAVAKAQRPNEQAPLVSAAAAAAHTVPAVTAMDVEADDESSDKDGADNDKKICRGVERSGGAPANRGAARPPRSADGSRSDHPVVSL